MSAQALATALGPPLMLHSASSSQVDEIDHVQPIAVLKYLLQIWPQPQGAVVSGNVNPPPYFGSSYFRWLFQLEQAPALTSLSVPCDPWANQTMHANINTESYVDRLARRATARTAWKQSQCVASGQTANHHQYYAHGHHTLNRSSSQQSSVSISSGSVSSIASSLATSGHGSSTGKGLISHSLHY